MILPALAASFSPGGFAHGAEAARVLSAKLAGGRDGDRRDWVKRCADRLGELCFHNDRAWLLRVAGELWEEVADFNPAIAAELEHESWLLDI